MTATGDPFERLPRSIRTRLDAFSAQVDGVTTNELQLFGVRRRGADEAAHEAARGRSQELARRTSRTTAIDAIHDVAFDYVARRFSQPIVDARRPFVGGSAIELLTRGDERARLAASFADALTAIALADVLDPADVDALLGRWAELADAAAAR